MSNSFICFIFSVAEDLEDVEPIYINLEIYDYYLKKRYIRIYRDMNKYHNGKFTKLLMLDIKNAILEALLKV